MTAERTDARADDENRRRRWLGFALFAVSVLPFLPTLAGGWFWDDFVNVERNPVLRDRSGLIRIWTDPLASFQYYPITYSAFWLQSQLFGERPAWFHAVSLILHATNALLAWRLLDRIGVPWAWFAAMLWAVHPMQAETVGWITEQKNLLSTLFALLALHAWIDLELTGRWIPALRATLWFAAALLAKTVVVALVPFLILRGLVLGGPHRRIRFAVLAVWLAIGLGLGAVTVWRETATSARTGSPADTPPRLSWAERTTLASANLVHYLRTFVWPSPLAPIPPRSVMRDSFAPAIVLLLCAGVFASLAVRGQPAPLLGAAFFVAMLGPTLGFVAFQFQCHADTADHFVYLPLLGLTPFVAGFGWIAFRQRIFGWILATLVLTCSIGLTWNDARVFADSEKIWRHTLAVNPQAWGATINLGSLLLERNRDAEAAAVLERGLALMPEAPDLHVNMGLAYAKLQRFPEAERHIRKALEAFPKRADLWRGFGNVAARQRNWSEAETGFRKAVALTPDDLAARFGLAAVLVELGRRQEAVDELDDILARDPQHAGARAARAALGGVNP